MISTKHAFGNWNSWWPNPLSDDYAIGVLPCSLTNQPFHLWFIPQWLPLPPISLFLSAPNNKLQSPNPLSSPIIRRITCSSTLIGPLFPPFVSQGYVPCHRRLWIPSHPHFPLSLKSIWVIGAIPFISDPGYSTNPNISRGNNSIS